MSLHDSSPTRVVGISGSPSARSRSAWLLRLAARRLGADNRRYHEIAVRELPANALLAADVSEPRIAQAVEHVADAQLLLISTPIYKAAYSGLLKSFLDLLPQDGLQGKTVLPLASGGSAGHLLALDYALRPVLSSLGARHILEAVYAFDAQLAPDDGGGFIASVEVVRRLDRAIRGLSPRPLAGPFTPRAAIPHGALFGGNER